MTGSSNPRVSVILPARNVGAYVGEAIASMLAQSFREFELIVIDDGSTDDTAAQVQKHADPRIRLIAREVGTGDLGMTLNSALELARGEYVARMDGDDVSLPGRLAAQVDYLDTHREVGLLGCWAEFIDDNGTVTGTSRPPTSPASVAFRLHYESPFHHPSVMFRKELVDRVGGYARGKAFAEDYDLWSRLAPLTAMANLGEVHFQQRVRSTSVSAQFPEGQSEVADEVGARLLRATIGRTPSTSALRRLRMGVGGPDSVIEATELLMDLQRAMKASAARAERRQIGDACVDALLQLWQTSGRRAGVRPFLNAARVRPGRVVRTSPAAVVRLLR